MDAPLEQDTGPPTAAQAWAEYLEATRAAGGDYADVEPWAWARLTVRLRDADLAAPDEAAA